MTAPAVVVFGVTGTPGVRAGVSPRVDLAGVHKLPLDQPKPLVCLDIVENLHRPSRPGNLEPVDPGGIAQAQALHGPANRGLRGAARDLQQLCDLADPGLDPGPDGHGVER